MSSNSHSHVVISVGSWFCKRLALVGGTIAYMTDPGVAILLTPCRLSPVLWPCDLALVTQYSAAGYEARGQPPNAMTFIDLVGEGPNSVRSGVPPCVPRIFGLDIRSSPIMKEGL